MPDKPNRKAHPAKDSDTHAPPRLAETFGNTAKRLVENGYLPVPITAGTKRPAVQRWTTFRYRDDDSRNSLWADCSVGIVTGRVVAIDIDVRNSALARAIEAKATEMLGIAPRRIGAAPKSMLLLRADRPFRKQSTGKYLLGGDAADSKRHCVEILCRGQQFVAFGIHPDTQRPYFWTGAGNPLTVRAADLPLLNEATAAKFIGVVDAMLQAFDCTGKPHKTIPARLGSEPRSIPTPQSDADRPKAIAAMKCIDPDCFYDDWLAVGMALQSANRNWFRLWVQWSQTGEKFKRTSEREMRAMWDGFDAQGGITIRTLFHIAERHRRDKSRNASLTQPRFTAYTLDEYLNRPPQEWRIKKLLPARGVAMVFAPSKAGKSFVTLEAVCRIACGEPFFGHETKQTGVVYIAGEGGHGLRDRIKAWVKVNGKKPPMAIIPTAPDLFTGGDLQPLVDEIKVAEQALGCKVQVVVVDTAATAMLGGDENSAKDMGRFIDNCGALARAIDGLVILVHHTGKDKGRGARGSSSISAAVDAELELVRDEHATVGTLRLSKLRDGEAGFDICGYQLEVVDLTFDEGDEPVNSCVVRSTNIPNASRPRSKPLPDSQLAALATLSTAITERGAPCEHSASSVGDKEWRQQYYAANPIDADVMEDERKKQLRARLVRFDRAREALCVAEIVCTANGRFWLPGESS